MENIQELIPFAKEMLSQKPSRGLLKVYLVGSVFAVLGTVIGLWYVESAVEFVWLQ
uniref:G0/G1 switch 2 n=1 Tax=Stegastes partitus TaxID=144197 RepID=A0A3B5B075_9TELE